MSNAPRRVGLGRDDVVGEEARPQRVSGFAPARRRRLGSDHGGVRGTLRYWPLVLVEFGESIDDAGVERVIEVMEAAYSRRETFIVIIDASQMIRPPGTTHRLRLAQYGAQNEHRSRRYSEGTAYAITSGLVRGALNAMLWVFRPPTATECLLGRHQAVDWCIRTLEGAGIDAKEEAYQLRRDTTLGREFDEVVR